VSTITTKDGTQIYYKGAPHGLCTTIKDQVNDDLLAFFKGKSMTASQ
jgi:non-heme chloroperoxidase